MYCEYCGEKLRKGSRICPNCGNQKDSVHYSLREEDLPEKYRPISMWGYFGYQILFSIPIIGWIMLFIFAFGSDENINIRNFARSYFCFLIVLVAIYLLFITIF